MKDFAKIFYTDNYGQILVTTQVDSEGDPEIAYRFGLFGNADNITVAHSFNDSTEGYAKRNFNFEKVDLARAISVADGFCKDFGFID